MIDQKRYTLEALRAVLHEADNRLCESPKGEDLDHAIWLVTAAAILADVAVEQRDSMPAPAPKPAPEAKPDGDYDENGTCRFCGATEGANHAPWCKTGDCLDDSFDAHFGLCPICGRNDGYLNIGKDHVFVCNEHRVWWPVGSNLFSSWQQEDETVWDRNLKKIQGYQKVEPIHSPNMLRKDHMLWPAIEPKVGLEKLARWHLSDEPQKGEAEKAIVYTVARAIGSPDLCATLCIAGDGIGYEVVDSQSETVAFVADDGVIRPNPAWKGALLHVQAIVASLKEGRQQ